jgi:hypothetical protein
MPKLTADTITSDQIRALRSERLDAGDYRTVKSCDVALSPHETADESGDELVDYDGDVTTRSDQRDLLADLLSEAQVIESDGRCLDALAAGNRDEIAASDMATR